MILCIGTTPAAQRVMVFRKLALDAVNRAVSTMDGAGGKSVNVAKILKTLGDRFPWRRPRGAAPDLAGSARN
jgi:fructose-1-phosphate kinase PfkB-like protein